jgi:hypothetical protein
LTEDHPCNEAKPVAKIEKLEISGDPARVREWIGEDFESVFAGITLEWVDPSENNGETGIVAVHFATPNGTFRLD